MQLLRSVDSCHMTVCLVLTGPPCAGKSTLAAPLAATLRWPLLSKDDYKERIFDHLGIGDRAWSRRVSDLAWVLLIREARTLLVAGACCIVEGNLRAPQRRALTDGGWPSSGVTRPTFMEIRCEARPEVLMARYRARIAAGQRHPGHVDLQALTEIEAELATSREATLPPLGGELLHWDTSEGFSTVDLEGALEAGLRRLGVPWSSAAGSGLVAR